MIVCGATTTARVEPSDEGGNISNEAIVGDWGRCGGTNDGGSGNGSNMWSGDDNRYIVMMRSWKSYDGSVFLGASRGGSRISGVGASSGGGGGNDGNGG